MNPVFVFIFPEDITDPSTKLYIEFHTTLCETEINFLIFDPVPIEAREM